MATEVGIVKTLIGTAIATAPDGSTRELHVGDRVYADEVITTGSAGAIELEFSDGNIMDLGRQSQVLLNSETINLQEIEKIDVEEDISVLQQALLDGKDPTQIGEATAAGIQSEGNEGITAENIEYLAPETPVTSGFETNGPTTNELNENDFFEEINLSNDIPIAVDNTFSLNEDGTITDTLASNDTKSGDGGNTWAVETDPAHGSASINADGTFTYTPADDYNGSDSFTYAITDEDGDSSTATVSLTVDSVNDVPIAIDDQFTLNEDASITDTLATNDTLSGDGGNVYSKASDPAHGSVSINADGTFTYTPADDYNGSDSFTYTLTDADGDTSTAAVSLTVDSVNDVPVAINDQFTLNEDASITDTLVTNDTLSGDGGNVYSKASDPAHGSVSISADGTFTYTPADDYSGSDSFTYTLTDADGDTSTAAVSLTVDSVNDMPVAINDQFTLNEDASISDTLVTNDMQSGDGGNVYAKDSDPAHGSVNINADGTFTYTPADDYSGSDSFTYTLTDADGDVSTATVNLNITPLGDVLTDANETQVINENSEATGNVLDNTDNVDGSSSVTAFTIDNQTANAGDTVTIANIGTLTIAANGAYAFMPDADYSGTVPTATYTVTDNTDPTDTATSTLRIQINSVDATDDGYEAAAQGEFSVAAFADGQEQSTPDIASLSDGGYVIAWTEVSGNEYRGVTTSDINNDGDLDDSGEISWGTKVNHDVFLQRYDVNGDPVGDAIRVNTLVTNTSLEGGRDQHDVNVVGLENGNYLVTWLSDDHYVEQDHYDNGSQYLEAQIYDENGNSVSDEFTIARAEYDPIIALPDGEFIVTWSADARLYNSDGYDYHGNANTAANTIDNPIVSDFSEATADGSYDGKGFGIVAQRYDAEGNPVGDRLLVNTQMTGDQIDSDVTMLADGSAIITWQSANQDGDGFGIYSQKIQLTANGIEKVGAEIAINTTVEGDQTDPEITALSNGTAVISWESSVPGQALVMQIIASDGTLIGNETVLSGTGSNPALTETNDGFVVVWQDAGNIQSQLFDFSGTALGNAFIINANTTGEQSEPAVTSLEDGGYVITYESADGISATRFNEDGSPYFQVQDSFSMNEDTSLTINVSDLFTNDSDPEGHGFEVTSVQDSVNGTAILSNDSSTIVFTPDADYNGPATFTYTVEDTLGATNTATVHMMVNSLNDGDNTIFASSGDDILIGGTGADEFVWYKAEATGSHDVVTDFNPDEGDTLNLADLLSDGSNTIEGLASSDENGNGEHLQLSIKDSDSNIIQTIDLTNIATTDATASSMLDTLLQTNSITDGLG